MSRVQPLEPADATDEQRVLMHQFGGGTMAGVLTRSPSLMQGFLAFGDALAHGSIRRRLSEQIALAVAEANQCRYCLSAHVHLAPAVGLDEDEIARNRRAESAEPETEVALRFVREVVDRRGGVSDETLAAVRAAGYTDRQILDLVGHAVVNTFTNYVNRVADTALEHPAVEPQPELAAPSGRP